MIDVINAIEDLQKYLLASIEIGQNMQDWDDLVVTDDKLNDTSISQALDPVYKNVLRKQNPFEIVFKDISKFDGQNYILRNLLGQIKSVKLTDVDIKKFLKKAPLNKDIEIINRLQKVNTPKYKY